MGVSLLFPWWLVDRAETDPEVECQRVPKRATVACLLHSPWPEKVCLLVWCPCVVCPDPDLSVVRSNSIELLCLLPSLPKIHLRRHWKAFPSLSLGTVELFLTFWSVCLSASPVAPDTSDSGGVDGRPVQPLAHYSPHAPQHTGSVWPCIAQVLTDSQLKTWRLCVAGTFPIQGAGWWLCVFPLIHPPGFSLTVAL